MKSSPFTFTFSFWAVPVVEVGHMQNIRRPQYVTIENVYTPICRRTLFPTAKRWNQSQMTRDQERDQMRYVNRREQYSTGNKSKILNRIPRGWSKKKKLSTVWPKVRSSHHGVPAVKPIRKHEIVSLTPGHNQGDKDLVMPWAVV
jgi:hypothetical protein